MYLPLRNSLFSFILISAASFALSNEISMADPTKTETFSVSQKLSTGYQNVDLALPEFNTSLGTLESVDLTLTVNGITDIKVYNTTGTPESFANASLSEPLYVNGPDGIKFSMGLGATLGSGTAPLLGLNCFTSIDTTESLSQGVGTAAFGLFENQPGGVVNFDYKKGNPTYSGTDLGSGLFFGGKEKGSSELEVVYTYLNSSVQPTPEPASMFLSLIVALAMTGLLAGRAKGFLRA